MARSHAERQMILWSAATAARRGSLAGQAEGLSSGIDWTVMAADLRVRRLLPTLGPRIIELAGGNAGPDFAAAVEDAVGSGRRHAALLQLISQRAIGVLAEAGIRSAALKGPQLAEALYGDPGRRFSGDLDLLVSPRELRAAADVIGTLGYRPPRDHVLQSGLPLLHYELEHENGELPSIELHWRIHWYEESFAEERLLPPTVESSPGWCPAAAAELTSLLLFYARDGFAGLRQASDLSAWWDAKGSELPPGDVPALLAAHPGLARAVRAAAVAAEQTVGVPAGPIIGPSVRLGVRERLAVRLAAPNPDTTEAQLYADMGAIDGLLMPPGDLRGYWRRQIVPPPEVRERQAQRAARTIARRPWARGAGTLARYAITASRLLHEPEQIS
jgi:hypothetical protein